MRPHWTAQLAQHVRCISAAMAAACLLQACQTYEPRPLDLPAYRDAFDARTVSFQPIEAFIERLQDSPTAEPLEFDTSDGLSPAEGEVVALFYNPALRITRLEAGVALATRDNAGLWEDPVFGFDGADILSPSGQPFEWGVGISLTIPVSGRLGVERDRASAAYDAHLRALVDAEWRTRAHVRTAWARWTAATEEVALIATTIEQLQSLDETVSHLADLGELNRVQRRLFSIEIASQEAAHAEVQLEAIEATTTLLGILGLPPTAADLLRPAFPTTVSTAPENSTARLIASNTELAVHFAHYRVAEETLRLEIQKQFPDIVIGPGYGTEFNDHRVMFGISVPLPILNANKAAIAEARAKREVARASAETTFADLERRLVATLASLHLAQQQRALFESRIVPLLNDQMHDLQRIAEFGEIDLFIMLETTTRQLRARTQLLALKTAQVQAATTAALILGPDDPTPPAPVIVDAPDLRTDETQPSRSGGV